ncbi:hypothetical protein [Vibrio aestuarianus]|uniref:hypothetical protein n=1 Tax=Vibrio aestuarianus TaxID=28171 RepID=UPI00249BEB4C|nr:hypothetical protein [Vibrio aestuarianus]WDS54563.1 hypothetical protein MCL29_01760 [Vibrio aestuarianus]
MTYNNYENQLDLAMGNSKARRALRKHFGKKLISYDEFIDAAIGTISDAETINLLAREKQWVDTGSPTIFIENKDLAHQLYSASFDVKDFNVESPFKTFALSFPKGTVIEGITMQTTLVSIMTVAECIKINRDILNVFPSGDALESSDELCVCLSKNDSAYIACGHSYLSTYDDPMLKSQNGEAITEQDILMKIALSLCVYHSATEGNKLEKGFPKAWAKKSKVKNKANGCSMVLRGMGCGSKPSNTTTNKERKITLKVPFFRNLRAARYYQGKHKNKPIGTRWVFVQGIDLNGCQHSLLS